MEAVSKSPQSPVYQRLDLGKNEIRLLELLPIRTVNGVEQDVECKLFVTSLDDAPDYRALSYAWGNKSKHQDIFLDGKPFTVTSNLYSALWHLQSTYKKIIWADAVCINQNDNTERSEQVGKMRTIYERATSITVWLGERSASTHLAFAMLEEMYQNRTESTKIADILTDAKRIESLESIVKLFNREYWFRIWVIQEVNSAKEITIMCGRYKIDWRRVESVQDMLWAEHKNKIMERSINEPRLFEFDTVINHQGVKALALPPRDTPAALPKLHTLLSAFYDKKGTDPRDKVYALVGLTTARDDPRFVIDYSASISQVYIDVVKFFLVSSEKLDVICLLPRGVNQYNLPSWVPDWNIQSTPDANAYGSPLATLLLRKFGTTYTAAGASKPKAEIKHSDRELHANGIILSVVEFLGRRGDVKQGKGRRTGVPILLDWYRMYCLHSTEVSAAEQVETFCRTVFHDQFSASELDYSGPLDFMERILSALAILAAEICPDEHIEPYLKHLGSKFDDPKWWGESYINDACEYVRGRRLFIGSSNIVGIGPSSIEPGDLVCILFGCMVPVILRLQNGYYTYIGHAYTHGYMYGKAMEEVEAGKFKQELFKIR